MTAVMVAHVGRLVAVAADRRETSGDGTFHDNARKLVIRDKGGGIATGAGLATILDGVRRWFRTLDRPFPATELVVEMRGYAAWARHTYSYTHEPDEVEGWLRDTSALLVFALPQGVRVYTINAARLELVERAAPGGTGLGPGGFDREQFGRVISRLGDDARALSQSTLDDDTLAHEAVGLVVNAVREVAAGSPFVSSVLDAVVVWPDGTIDPWEVPDETA